MHYTVSSRNSQETMIHISNMKMLYIMMCNRVHVDLRISSNYRVNDIKSICEAESTKTIRYY